MQTTTTTTTASDATEALAEMQRVKDGDADGIGALYDRLGSQALGIAVRVLGNRELAEEAVQEAFLGVWRNAARFDPERASVRTWVFAIVHHRAVDAVRRRRPPALPIESGIELEGLPTTPDVWEQVLPNLDRLEIARALGTLGPQQRRCIELAYFGGLTQTEIAALTRTPLGTVKSRVRLGLIRLREAMTTAAGQPTTSPPRVRRGRRVVAGQRATVAAPRTVLRLDRAAVTAEYSRTGRSSGGGDLRRSMRPPAERDTPRPPSSPSSARGRSRQGGELAVIVVRSTTRR